MLALDYGRTVIARARIRTGAPDPLLARLQVESALANATLAPDGLPPSAILLVRKLADSSHDRLGIGRGSLGVRPEWEHALRSRLAALAACAARPTRNAVPESAEAVLFADESELLACLARDWVHGAGARWWWRTLFPDRDLAAAVIRAWRDRVECVPAAMRHLHASGDDAIVVSRLGARVVGTFLQAVLRVYGLTQLGAALAMLFETQPARSEKVTGRTAESGLRATLLAQATRVDAPWSHYLPTNTAASLGPQRAAFLGVCLSLADAPQSTRTSAYAARLREWVRYQLPAESERIVVPAALTPDPNGDGPRPSPGEIDRDGAIPAEATPIVLRAVEHPIPGDWAHAPLGHVPPVPLPAAREHKGAARAMSPQGPPPVPHESGLATGAGSEPCIETEWGGVLFLINLGLFLELYGDFANPGRAGIELPVWDFAALIGEDLAGPGLREDPIWALLAQLSGRGTHEEPGVDFHPQPDWRMPVSWLRSAAPGSLARARIRRGRLRVLHAAGFAVLDLPVRPRHARTQLAREIAPYVHAGVVDEGALPPPARTRHPAGSGTARARRRGATLAQWLGWMLPFVRHRLVKALGLQHTADIAPALLQRAARVFVTPTRIDARFALAELPVAVRLSGLDRDPGWVPAAGRTIRFHFE